MTHGKICYLEIPAKRAEDAAAFYANIFGWGLATSTSRTSHRRRREINDTENLARIRGRLVGFPVTRSSTLF